MVFEKLGCVREEGLMDDYMTLKKQAEEKLKIADHLLSTTYLVVKEPKLLVSVIENIFRAIDLSIVAVLAYEKHFKNIPNYGQTFEECSEMFRRKIMPKYSLSSEFLEFAQHMKEMVDEYKKTSTAFTKKQTFVIADNDFNVRLLTEPEVKKTLAKAKILITHILAITEQHTRS